MLLLQSNIIFLQQQKFLEARMMRGTPDFLDKHMSAPTQPTQSLQQQAPAPSPSRAQAPAPSPARAQAPAPTMVRLLSVSVSGLLLPFCPHPSCPLAQPSTIPYHYCQLLSSFPFPCTLSFSFCPCTDLTLSAVCVYGSSHCLQEEVGVPLVRRRNLSVCVLRSVRRRQK